MFFSFLPAFVLRDVKSLDEKLFWEKLRRRVHDLWLPKLAPSQLYQHIGGCEAAKLSLVLYYEVWAPGILQFKRAFWVAAAFSESLKDHPCLTERRLCMCHGAWLSNRPRIQSLDLSMECRQILHRIWWQCGTYLISPITFRTWSLICMEKKNENQSTTWVT